MSRFPGFGLEQKVVHQLPRPRSVSRYLAKQALPPRASKSSIGSKVYIPESVWEPNEALFLMKIVHQDVIIRITGDRE